jgi:hypothetical protein
VKNVNIISTCAIRKNLVICVRYTVLNVNLLRQVLEKKLKKTKKGEYSCNSPFGREKLVCVKRRDIGKRICERCGERVQCGMMPVFNGCGIPNCSLSVRQEVLDLFANWSLSHYHMLCQSCYFRFPAQYVVSYIKNVAWRKHP